MPAHQPPVHLVASGDVVLPGAARMLPAGWSVRDGFALPSTPWDLSSRRWVCAGTVATHDDAVGAVTALARGVGMLVSATLSGDDRRRFEEDLAHIIASPVDADEPPWGLEPEHRALLEGLASGLSLTAAATEAHLSRRTANRRLAEARDRLDVETTAEAVTRWRARTRFEDQLDR